MQKTKLVSEREFQEFLAEYQQDNTIATSKGYIPRDISVDKPKGVASNLNTAKWYYIGLFIITSCSLAFGIYTL